MEAQWLHACAGASGFVIESSAADKLGMARFGKFHCSGMMDNVEICLRRSDDFSLGPLTIQDPLFMEMQLGGLVRGAPGQVIGIVGCAFPPPHTSNQTTVLSCHHQAHVMAMGQGHSLF